MKTCHFVGLPSLFLPHVYTAAGMKAECCILEVQAVSPHSSRSWFLDEGQVIAGVYLRVLVSAFQMTFFARREALADDADRSHLSSHTHSSSRPPCELIAALPTTCQSSLLIRWMALLGTSVHVKIFLRRRHLGSQSQLKVQKTPRSRARTS